VVVPLPQMIMTIIVVILLQVQDQLELEEGMVDMVEIIIKTGLIQ
jgi:hypothetical protein